MNLFNKEGKKKSGWLNWRSQTSKEELHTCSGISCILWESDLQLITGKSTKRSE